MKRETVGTHGPRALVLHGNDLCGAHYRALAEALATRGARAELVTLPGFSREPALTQPSWDALVDAVLDACAPDPPDALVGHSMGGLLALLCAARQPPWLRALALLEPAVFPHRVVARAASRRYLARVVRAPIDTPFQNSNGGQRRVAALARYPRALLTLHDEVRNASDKRTAEVLFASAPSLYPLPVARVCVPVCLVRGARSGWLSRAQIGWLARTLRTRPHVVADAAHWLVGEADDAVAEVLASFLHAHAWS